MENDKCRSIGVSNFNEKDLEDLIDIATIVPHVNQHEFHPYQNPQKLRQYCEENRIQFQVHKRTNLLFFIRYILKYTNFTVEHIYKSVSGTLPLSKREIIE